MFFDETTKSLVSVNVLGLVGGFIVTVALFMQLHDTSARPDPLVVIDGAASEPAAPEATFAAEPVCTGVAVSTPANSSITIDRRVSDAE